MNVFFLLSSVALLLLFSCAPEQKSPKRTLGFDQFRPNYNQYIAQWLEQTKKERLQELESLKKNTPSPQDAKTAQKIQELQTHIDQLSFRQSLGDYLAIKRPEDIPPNLDWKTGMDQPPIGDPQAKKGGSIRFSESQYPPTLRRFGPKSNHSFRGKLYDEFDLGCVGIHPVTNQFIPAVASSWAIGPDKRTVYYKIDPDAAYSDGVKVRAKDFLVHVYLRTSDYVTDPFYKQYFREQIAQVAMYDEQTISITLPSKKPWLPYYANLSPAPSHFYQDYGPDFEERYQWKVQPTTGPYFVRPSDIIKGSSITLTRNKNWWAKDKKYYRHRFNVDRLIYSVILDGAKAFELFRAGKIDTIRLDSPEKWHHQSEIPPVHAGYIERYQFYTQYPLPPRGLYWNFAKKKIQNKSFRLGVAHALNWQKAIDSLYRGDFTRLESFSSGFGSFTNPQIRSRRFSIQKARTHFHQAGFTKTSNDGILMRPNGERLTLSITVPGIPAYKKLLTFLAEEAKKTGLEIQIDDLEPTVSYKKVMDKQHEATYWGWNVTPPFPRYYQFFHSTNAYDEKGNPKSNTNNISSYQNPVMDQYCEIVRNAQSIQELQDASWKIQELIYQDIIMIPSYAIDFVRTGSWRWVRWPNTSETPYNVPLIGDPYESHLFWIDDQLKQDTLRAKRKGIEFPEVQQTIDQFRVPSEQS